MTRAIITDPECCFLCRRGRVVVVITIPADSAFPPRGGSSYYNTAGLLLLYGRTGTARLVALVLLAAFPAKARPAAMAFSRRAIRDAVAPWWASRWARSASEVTFTWKVADHRRDARPLSPYITAHRSAKLRSKCSIWPGKRCSPTNARESDKAAHSARRRRRGVIPAL